MNNKFHIAEENLPTYNLEISFGGKDRITIFQNVKRTIINRFRYWMLAKFFPFKIERWTDGISVPWISKGTEG